MKIFYASPISAFSLLHSPLLSPPLSPPPSPSSLSSPSLLSPLSFPSPPLLPLSPSPLLPPPPSLRFLLHLVVSPTDRGVSVLNVVETNPFRHLNHLSLKFVPASDSYLKKYLAECLLAAKVHT